MGGTSNYASKRVLKCCNVLASLLRKDAQDRTLLVSSKRASLLPAQPPAALRPLLCSCAGVWAWRQVKRFIPQQWSPKILKVTAGAMEGVVLVLMQLKEV